MIFNCLIVFTKFIETCCDITEGYGIVGMSFANRLLFNFNSVIENFFTYWGVNSLIMMCTHFSITMEVLMAFDRHVLHHTIFEGPRTIIYFVICVLLTYPLAWLFNNKLKFMLGKK